MADQWYAIKVDATREDEVKKRLADQELMSCYPTCLLTRVKGGLVERRTVPLFPTYMFARLDVRPGTNWQRAAYTRGVQYILGAPSPIRDYVVDGLMSAAPDALEIGKPVKVVGGVFDGVFGLLSERGEDRVKVLFTLLGRKVEKVMSLQHVAAV